MPTKGGTGSAHMSQLRATTLATRSVFLLLGCGSLREKLSYFSWHNFQRGERNTQKVEEEEKNARHI
jgi:hypothetical protein